MSLPTIAILGGRGMLGTDLTEVCQAAGNFVKVFDLPDFDVTDRQQVSAALSNCDIVINCAAYTNVDGAQSEPELACRVNADAVGQLGDVARALGVWVLHISTDFVFDGALERPYNEEDTPNPLSVYGATKLAGEQQFFASGCAGTVVRVQWTYGHHGNNFVKKLLTRAQTQPILKVVDDQVGSPTATADLARVLLELLHQRTSGLFHCASRDYVSRFDMARYIVETLGVETEVVPCKTCEFKSPAARPLNSRFDCQKLTAVLDCPLPRWQDSLNRFLERL